MLRIGMLTSGGECQALNAAMRGVVKGVCTKRDDVEIYGFEDGYKGLIYGNFHMLTSKDFSGILTRGGTILGTSRQPFKLMRVMRGVVKGVCTKRDDVEIYGFEDGYKGLIYGNFHMLTSKDFSGILTRGGTILGTSRQPFKLMRVPDKDGLDKVAAMKHTYHKLSLDCLVILGGNGTHKTANLLREEGSILGTSRQPFKLMRVPDKDGLDKVAAMKHTYHKLSLDCLVILGGNGTHKTANLLREEGLNVVTLPKTIDNDLWGTDMTFGFQSAVDIATDTIDRIHTTATGNVSQPCVYH